MTVCGFAGCGLPVTYRGYCRTHYRQWRAGEQLRPFTPRVRSTTLRLCSVDGCSRRHQAKGYCDAHYQQLRAGKPIGPIRRYGELGKPCPAKECGRPIAVGGLCWTHYEQARTGKKLTEIARREKQSGKCLVPTCDKPAKSRSVCGNHTRLRTNFNLTDDQIVSIFSDPHCEICGTRNPGKRYFHMDHDHSCCPVAGMSCGKCVRGLLCGACNRGLGSLSDDIEKLQSAIEYLEKYRAA